MIYAVAVDGGTSRTTHPLQGRGSRHPRAVRSHEREGRFEVLESNQAVVVEQCGAALEAVTDPGLEHQAALLKTCVGMAGDGCLPGAQALASNVLDTLFRGVCRAEPNL
jgi:hypothetical protein